MTSQMLQDSNELYRQLHENPDIFYGFSLKLFIHDIGQLIRHSNIRSINDYGCGKAQAWKQYNLQKLWNVKDVGWYDPGVEKYSTPITVPRDLTICIDVMEHIPEECIDEVLDEINRITTKVVFFNICTRPAGKQLPDGRNAHVTVKSQEWWKQKLKRLNKLVITHYT